MSSPPKEDELIIEDPDAFERRLAEREAEACDRPIAENTRRGYESDWRDFTAWCSEHDSEPTSRR